MAAEETAARSFYCTCVVNTTITIHEIIVIEI